MHFILFLGRVFYDFSYLLYSFEDLFCMNRMFTVNIEFIFHNMMLPIRFLVNPGWFWLL